MVTNYPVDDKLTVQRGEDVYRSDEWWKAVLQYHFGDKTESLETAIYLWHNDEEGGWRQKNKYVVKTLEAWEEDQDLLATVRDAPTDPEADDRFPVNDFFTVGAGETVFKTEDWWKAIVRIEEKGDYETQEYNIYIWQKQDGSWRRRQKYAIKRFDDWDDERAIVSRMLTEEATIDNDTRTKPEESSRDGTFDLSKTKAENHLSNDLKEGW